MSTPQALIQIAGVGFRPASSLNNATLVLIDIQREYLPEGKVPLEGFNNCLAKSRELLDRARAVGAPVVHVVHHGPSGSGFYDPSGFGGVVCDEVAPKEGEPLVQKNHVNAFIGTTMEESLKAAGRKELIVIGCMTHMCLSTFVRAATEQHGYACTVVAECTATRALPNPWSGDMTPAKEVQQSNLAALSDFFATVVPSVADVADK